MSNNEFELVYGLSDEDEFENNYTLMSTKLKSYGTYSQSKSLSDYLSKKISKTVNICGRISFYKCWEHPLKMVSVRSRVCKVVQLRVNSWAIYRGRFLYYSHGEAAVMILRRVSNQTGSVESLVTPVGN